MKKLLVIALAALMIFALVGCKSPANVPGKPDTKVTPSPTEEEVKLTPNGGEAIMSFEPKDKFEALYWASFRSGGSAEAQLKYEPITNFKELEKRFGGRMDELGERFGKKTFQTAFVVAVYLTVNTGGYTVGVNSASIENGVAHIDISKVSPDPGAMVTQAFETHTVLIEFDKAGYSEDLTYVVTVNGQPAEGFGETE